MCLKTGGKPLTAVFIYFFKDNSNREGELYLENSHMQNPKVLSWNNKYFHK